MLNNVKSELYSIFNQNNVSFLSFGNNFVNVLNKLNKHAGKESKLFQGNQKPNLNKSIIAVSMKPPIKC